MITLRGYIQIKRPTHLQSIKEYRNTAVATGTCPTPLAMRASAPETTQLRHGRGCDGGRRRVQLHSRAELGPSRHRQWSPWRCRESDSPRLVSQKRYGRPSPYTLSKDMFNHREKLKKNSPERARCAPARPGSGGTPRSRLRALGPPCAQGLGWIRRGCWSDVGRPARGW